MKKKLDLFNFFYSLGAVIILIGVIAKLLEWEGQDVFMTLGLSIEVLIFALSAFKYKDVEKENETYISNDFGPNFNNPSEPGTYINIQNGKDPLVEISEADASLNNYKSYLNSTDSFSIDINVDQFAHLNMINNTSYLDKIIALSQVEDLFYQPEWYQLSAEDYNKLIVIIKNVFGKRMPNYEFLPILIQSPIKLPVPNYNQLSIANPVELSIDDIEIISRAFSLVHNYNILDHFVFQELNNIYLFRQKEQHELQIFGGEQPELITHIKSYLNYDFVISPNISAINELVFFNDTSLIEELISTLSFENVEEFSSLNKLVIKSNDELRTKLFKKTTPFVYDASSNKALIYIQEFVQLALQFDDKESGLSLFENNIQYLKENGDLIQLKDIINFSNDIIYFGNKNEYTISLNELFAADQLSNLAFINTIINDLLANHIANKVQLYELFGLQMNDFKNEIYTKLNENLTNNKLSPNGSQLAFLLLYKQYNSTY